MPPHSTDEVGGEIFEIQHQLLPHANDHHQSHYPSFVEEINAILHGTTPGLHGNGSQTGSGSALTGSSGQGVGDDGYHFIVVGAFIVPIVLTIGLIFLIALLVRRMRRAESLKEMRRRNELGMRDVSTSPSGSLSTSTSPSPSSSSSMSLHMVGNQSSSGSEFDGQSTPPSPTSSQTPHQFNPPWFLYSTSYYRSQYNLNKLQQEMSSYMGSVQSLPTHQFSSAMSPYITEPLSTYDTEDDSKANLKRSSSAKRFKRVFHIINFPKRIRQHQADKNRFNIYTVPIETREQLKQIYVY